MWIFDFNFFLILIFLYFCECINNNNQNLTYLPQNLNNNITKDKNYIEETNEEDNGIAWVCGTDPFTQMISESTIERDCPDKKVPINNCCIEHDSCYDEQKGRNYCDDNFCECLNKASSGSKECNEVDTKLFCDLVKDFGETYYNASVHTNNTSNTSKIIEMTTTPILIKKEENNNSIPRIY